MEQIGVVTGINHDMAEMTIERMSACGEHCKGCTAGCEIKNHVIQVPNSLNAKVGDRVALMSESKLILKYLLLIYGVPFVGLVLGMFIGYGIFGKAKEGLIILTALACLGLGFLAVRLIDRKFPQRQEQVISMSHLVLEESTDDQPVA